MKTGLSYVYRITNMVDNKYYYGSRTTKSLDILPINDNGIKYFSSSHDKTFIKEQKVFPELFSRWLEFRHT